MGMLAVGTRSGLVCLSMLSNVDVIEYIEGHYALWNKKMHKSTGHSLVQIGIWPGGLNNLKITWHLMTHNDTISWPIGDRIFPRIS